METKETRTCVECGRVFVPNGPRQIYCKNEDCPGVKRRLQRSASYYKTKGVKKLGGQVIATCKVCGKKFLADTLKFKFCSEECKAENKRYTNRVAYAKRMGYPTPPTPLEERRALKAQTKAAQAKAAESAKPQQTYEGNFKKTERTTTMYENRNANINIKKPHYSPEETDAKMTAKTKRIIDTIHTLESANIDAEVIFEAIKSITRMPLSKF